MAVAAAAAAAAVDQEGASMGTVTRHRAVVTVVGTGTRQVATQVATATVTVIETVTGTVIATRCPVPEVATLVGCLVVTDDEPGWWPSCAVVFVKGFWRAGCSCVVGG